jgi:hypothetical protein
LVSAALLFFFGRSFSGSSSAVVAKSCWSAVELSVPTELRIPRFSLSTLDAGVRRGGGDSALRLDPTEVEVTNGGGSGGSAVVGISGVEPGVGAGVLLEYVRGTEW